MTTQSDVKIDTGSPEQPLGWNQLYREVEKVESRSTFYVSHIPPERWNYALMPVTVKVGPGSSISDVPGAGYLIVEVVPVDHDIRMGLADNPLTLQEFLVELEKVRSGKVYVFFVDPVPSRQQLQELAFGAMTKMTHVCQFQQDQASGTITVDVF